MKTDLVSSEELEGVKRRARANLIRAMEDNMGLADNLTRLEVLTGSWKNLFKLLDKINAVTREDVQRVAKATFTASNRTVGIIEPIEPPAGQGGNKQ